MARELGYEPFMTDEDIKIIEQELFSRKDIDILEWGAGGSTTHFAGLLTGKSINFRWDALEYNKSWYEIIRCKHLKNVYLYCFPEPRWEKRKLLKQKMDGFVTFPRFLHETTGRTWDVIFVDGRKRVRCMKEAVDLLNPNGIIFLHDCDRDDYKPGMDLFDGEKLTRKLWKGKLKSQ